MAGDWIKMRTDLYRDPKVSSIADDLLDRNSELSSYVNQNLQCDMSVTRNVMRNAVVGALVALWGVMRHQGKRVGDDLVVRSSLSAIDDTAELQGFSDALLGCGWLIKGGETLTFPRFFEENNVDPKDDAKAKNRERQRRYRDAHSNVTRNVTVTPKRNAREEKRREENKQTRQVEYPDWLDMAAWDDWKQHRKEIKKPMTPLAEQMAIKKLKDMANGITQRQIIDNSISNGYQGLYAPNKQNGKPERTGNPAASRPL